MSRSWGKESLFNKYWETEYLHAKNEVRPLPYESEVKVLVAQLCPTLCNLMDCSPPDSYVHGISQARILKWVAIPFSRGSSHAGIELMSLALQADSLPSEAPGKPPGKWL